MATTRSSSTLACLAGALLLLAAGPIFAADPLIICTSGQPYLWPDGGVDIPFNPDQGDLGPLDHDQAVALTQASFDRWGDLPTTSASYVNAGELPVDVDITNFLPWLNPPAPDGYSAIVFDDTGEIFEFLFGFNSGVLGFATPEWGIPATCEILEGLSFLNGPEFTDLIFAEDVMVHEFGHYSNLAHVELNGQLVSFSEGGDDSGPSPDNATFGTVATPGGFDGTEVIETMYPILFLGIDQGTRTPHADDIASISTLYPGAGFLASTGTISGTIFAANGTTRLSGVNVIARNIADPFLDAVSAISGGFTDSLSQADPVVGTFTLNGLTPGAQYGLFVDEISAQAGRFSTPALQPLPGPEEFWNGANESADPDVDDPLELVLIEAVAGSPASGTDIVFNRPGPGVIPLGDDDFAEIGLPFEYEICGQVFASVFVNSNGSLTFGSGDTDYTESASELLRDQPRIAGLWDDLNPSQGGTVSFSFTANTFTVRFDGVPEYFSAGANSFEFTLDRASDHIDIDYGAMTAVDGLAGVSCGGAIASGLESGTDLSAFAPSRINLHNQPAVFEQFSFASPNDLSWATARFNGTTDYNDDWAEPNDTLAEARKMQLPFDTVPIARYSETEPSGGDVDFYRFTAQAGTTLAIEIIAGHLDSTIGLFDPAGNLVAFDDDDGVGLLSKLTFPITADGEYSLAVTTFPDFDFDGDGFSGGRYVLQAAAVTGFLLELGDDDSEEVPLGFVFPYQGASWTSVWVNSNGNLTFGGGDTDFSESVSELLAGLPRIAPLWDDLNPAQGGQVSAELDAGSAAIRFAGVPEFFSTGANSFTVTLRSDGTVEIDYGSVSALDGLAGITEGGGAADPGETDLSAAAGLSASGTSYERFTGSSDPFDLDFLTLLFIP